MNIVSKVTCIVVAGAICCNYATAQSKSTGVDILLNDLNPFKKAGKNWVVASSANSDFNKPGDLTPVKGTGAVLNINSPKNNSQLVTNREFGDLELDLDFMMVKGSNSGVYLQGRYEIQLFDSWGKLNPTYSDCGGVYQRWDEKRTDHKGYEGIAPLTNAAKAPGLWQHLHLVFRAPKFDASGQKTANARFEEVHLNGALVQDQVEVTGPTRSGMFEDEKSTGPLMFQGDHGKVAFKNIKYSIPQESAKQNQEGIANPILVNPVAKPYLLRSFMGYGDKKLTHVISVGNPNQTNYSYDLSRGALIQFWRGRFVDATDMWFERGEPYQWARPAGSLTILSDAPSIAVLVNSDTAWPDSIPFEAVKVKGYTLDADRAPSFQYTVNGVNVSDKITSPNATTLFRQITIENPSPNLKVRVLKADKIASAGKGRYIVNDKSYFIKLDEKVKPLIRQSDGGQELIIPVEKASTVSYSIIW